MSVLASITVLLLCQLAGETIAHLFALPVPGPVIGMLILFAALVIGRGLPRSLEQTANFLLSNLSLLFIPAGTGVVVYVGLITRQWLPISTALVAGTAITMAVTGLTMSWLLGRSRRSGS